MRLYLALSLCALLIGCVGTGDGGSIPLVPLRGGGSAAPSKPILPPLFEIKSEEEAPQLEQHGAATAAECRQMEKRFREEGRKIRLKEVKNNPYNTGGVLQFLCVFTGQDAKGEPDAFEDYRYNSKDEYQHP